LVNVKRSELVADKHLNFIAKSGRGREGKSVREVEAAGLVPGTKKRKKNTSRQAKLTAID